MRSLFRNNVVTVIALGFLVCRVSAGASDHKYKDGQAVPLYANKVGPFHNPRYLPSWMYTGPSDDDGVPQDVGEM